MSPRPKAKVKSKPPVAKPDLAGILRKFRKDPSSLIAILHAVQNHYHYLPKEALTRVAKFLDISPAEVYHVATFFRAFTLKPRGRNHIQVCLGTACHLKGGSRIAEEFENRLKIQRGQATPDLQFSLDTVNCVGACALAPLVIINRKYYPKLNASQVNRLIQKIRKGES